MSDGIAAMMKDELDAQNRDALRYISEATKDIEVDNPAHYAESFEFEVYEVIKHILDTYYQHSTPYDIWQVGNELKYRFRMGLKDDGHNGAKDAAKAMRCRQMRSI